MVELLAVFAVVMVFCTLLLPVLAGARTRAMDTVCTNHLSHLTVGASLYAHDHDEVLPAGADRRMLPNCYFSNRHDLLSVGAEYEFLAYTGHPATGSATWDHPDRQPSREFDDSLWSSWFYFPGWDRLGPLAPPSRLNQSGPGAVMFQDGLFRDREGVRERVTHSRESTHYCDGRNLGQPSLCFFAPLSPEMVTGHHLSRYDGSVERREHIEAGYLSTVDTEWRIGHFFPEPRPPHIVPPVQQATPPKLEFTPEG